MTYLKHIQIDCRRVVHQIGVMLTPKDVTGATDVGGKKVDLIEATIHYYATEASVTQVAHYKIIRFGFQEFVKFQINPAHPEAVTFEPFD